MRAGGWIGVFLVLIGLLQAPDLAAKEMSQKIKNAINHAAQVIVIQGRCSKIEVNDIKIALMLTAIGVDLEDPVQRRYMSDRIREHGDAVAGQSDADICIVGLYLYGPKGENVPGLINLK